jgi:hypothetical protein
MADLDQEPRPRKVGKKLPDEVLGREGSDCSVLGLLLVLLPTNWFSEGTGGRVGSSAGWLLVLASTADVVPVPELEGMSGVGFPACASSIHPARKDTRLVMVNQTRRPNFNGFIIAYS